MPEFQSLAVGVGINFTASPNISPALAALASGRLPVFPQPFFQSVAIGVGHNLTSWDKIRPPVPGIRVPPPLPLNSLALGVGHSR